MLNPFALGYEVSTPIAGGGRRGKVAFDSIDDVRSVGGMDSFEVP